jgi:hypothetical protein
MRHQYVNQTAPPPCSPTKPEARQLGSLGKVSDKEATVEDSDVTDEVKNDTLCPDRMFVLPPVRCDDSEHSKNKGRVGVR